MNHGKHYVDSAKLIDRTKTYEPQEALELCCKTAKAKFDETVELHVRLGVDSRHADQQVRGAVVLPNGTGKNVRVVAICKGDAAKAAEAAGAQEVGDVYLSAKPRWPLGLDPRTSWADAEPEGWHRYPRRWQGCYRCQSR